MNHSVALGGYVPSFSFVHSCTHHILLSANKVAFADNSQCLVISFCVINFALATAGVLHLAAALKTPLTKIMFLTLLTCPYPVFMYCGNHPDRDNNQSGSWLMISAFVLRSTNDTYGQTLCQNKFWQPESFNVENLRNLITCWDWVDNVGVWLYFIQRILLFPSHKRGINNKNKYWRWY